jgi:acyl carrier protein
MNEIQFLTEIQEVLELENFEMSLTDNFRTYDEWDSMTFLALVTHMRDAYGVILDIDTFNSISSWKDLYERINA